jgi:hypothetical protein
MKILLLHISSNYPLFLSPPFWARLPREELWSLNEDEQRNVGACRNSCRGPGDIALGRIFHLAGNTSTLSASHHSVKIPYTSLRSCDRSDQLSHYDFSLLLQMHPARGWEHNKILNYINTVLHAAHFLRYTSYTRRFGNLLHSILRMTGSNDCVL